MTDHTDIVERLASTSVVIGNLPQLPGYNGSVLTIDDEEAARCAADIDAGAAEITRLRAEAEALRKDKAQLVEALIHLRKWADWYGNADHAARGQLPLPPSGDVELTEDIAAALKPNE